MECVDVHKAKEILDQGQITIVDIRDGQSYAQAHIDQAISINDNNIEEFLTSANKENPLICYCYHGFSSQNAAQFFNEQGFKTVYSIDGGFEAWRATYPTVTNS